ncbi:ATP-grasp domain-containing protein [Streptomyces sp. NPDC005863]|uniref:ATP-grasp domain-containing protein n=1 Tax=unclassified Streptomyces TaxID=2593676 RepID=UPI003404E5C7
MRASERSPRSLLIVDVEGPDVEALLSICDEQSIAVYFATLRGVADVLGQTTHACVRDGVQVDYSLPEEAVSKIVSFCRDVGVEGVLTVNEFLTPVAAQVCHRLRLPGNDPLLAGSARNKIEMWERFGSAGMARPKTWIVDNEDEVSELMSSECLEYPVVIKPCENAGSTGVSIAFSRQEILDCFRHAKKLNESGPYSGWLDNRVLVQEYLTGPEYSVESVTRNGHTEHVCVTEKVTTGNEFRVDLGLGVPASLDDATRKSVQEQATKAVQAVGIRNGISHTEVKVGPSGNCTVVEVAARIAGGRIAWLVRNALGVDLWQACIDVALGNPVEVSATSHGYSAARFIVAGSPGRIVKLTNIPEVGGSVSEVNIRRGPGQDIAVDGSSSGRIGHFIVNGKDRDRVSQEADLLLSRILVEVA